MLWFHDTVLSAVISAEAALVAYRVNVCQCLQSRLKACDRGYLKSFGHLNAK
jgi:hypothetical protein